MDTSISSSHHHAGPAHHRREFENIVVRATSDGALVKIKDIARVELGSKISDSVGRYNGSRRRHPDLPASGANALATAQGVRKALQDLGPRFPDDVAYDVMYDTTVFVEATIESVHPHPDRGFRAGSRSWSSSSSAIFRATIIPIIAVPWP